MHMTIFSTPTSLPLQFTPNEACILRALGYECQHFDDEWQDDGDAETGPHLVGHPEMDVYTLRLTESSEHEVVVMSDEIVSISTVPVFPDLPF